MVPWKLNLPFLQPAMHISSRTLKVNRSFDYKKLWHTHHFHRLVARTPNFNPKKQTKTASFWKELSQLNTTIVEQFDEIHRNRLRALQAVDEMIGSLFAELEHQGKLDNTYVVYSADNG